MENIQQYRTEESKQKDALGTVIRSKTILKGDLQTSDPIIVEGCINGKVISSSVVVITGGVNGNVAAAKLGIANNDAYVFGDIKCEKEVTIGKGAAVIGNILSNTVRISGAIKGDIRTTEKLILDPTAIVYGNVSTKSLQMSDGAKICGGVEIIAPESEKTAEAIFAGIQQKIEAMAIEQKEPEKQETPQETEEPIDVEGSETSAAPWHSEADAAAARG